MRGQGSHVYNSHNKVNVLGEPLAPILWCGANWAVTRYGLEARDGTYAIEASRLWEGESSVDTGGLLPGTSWVEHMAEKNWVDLFEFAEALRIARKLHGATDKGK